MNQHQFLPVDDRNAQRNFQDVARLLLELPVQGVIGSRWRFLQLDDAVTCVLQYYDGKEWTTKATWTA